MSTRKTKKPCQTPGCDWPNWHVCLVGKPDTTQQILLAEKGKPPPSTMSDAQKEAISESQKERWKKIKREQQTLNDKIVARYKQEEISSVTLAQEFGVSKTRVLKALKEAASEGRVTIRPRGRTISRTSK